jgi:hypothetical protein
MATTHAEAAERATAQLGMLAGNLTGRGFTAHIAQPARYPCVRVAHGSVPQLSETIYAAYAAPADDGTWWFWWSWADRIARIGAVEPAAFKIAYVLTPHAHD